MRIVKREAIAIFLQSTFDELTVVHQLTAAARGDEISRWLSGPSSASRIRQDATLLSDATAASGAVVRGRRWHRHGTPTSDPAATVKRSASFVGDKHFDVSPTFPPAAC
jgi:hypothetical protein